MEKNDALESHERELLDENLPLEHQLVAAGLRRSVMNDRTWRV